jgi:hypothetical protein
VTGVASASDNIRGSVSDAAASAEQMAQSAENLAKLASDMEIVLSSFSLSNGGVCQVSPPNAGKRAIGMLSA